MPRPCFRYARECHTDPNHMIRPAANGPKSHGADFGGKCDMPTRTVSQLTVAAPARMPPSSRSSIISVSGIRCPDDLRERAYDAVSGISGRYHRKPCQFVPVGHVGLALPAPRGAMRRDGRADAISGRRGDIDDVRRCGGVGRYGDRWRCALACAGREHGKWGQRHGAALGEPFPNGVAGDRQARLAAGSRHGQQAGV